MESTPEVRKERWAQVSQLLKEGKIVFPVPDDVLMMELQEWKRRNPVFAYCQQFAKKED